MKKDSICQVDVINQQNVTTATNYLEKEKVQKSLRILSKFTDNKQINIIFYLLAVEELCVCDIALSLIHIWYVVDATDVPLGRLSAVVASVLRGKNKPTFTPHTDTGDFVIVINAEKMCIRDSARKMVRMTVSLRPCRMQRDRVMCQCLRT